MSEATTPITRAVTRDAGAIEELTLLAYAKWVPLIGREPLPMTVDYSDALRQHRFDLLHCGSWLAALIETDEEDDCLLIVNVAVHPDYQGRGFGRKLMAHAETLAVAAGFRRVRLYTNSRFEANIALYRSLGFSVDREESLDRGVITHMSKWL